LERRGSGTVGFDDGGLEGGRGGDDIGDDDEDEDKLGKGGGMVILESGSEISSIVVRYFDGANEGELKLLLLEDNKEFEEFDGEVEELEDA
jgi:hypothetical protein